MLKMIEYTKSFCFSGTIDRVTGPWTRPGNTDFEDQSLVHYSKLNLEIGRENNH